MLRRWALVAVVALFTTGCGDNQDPEGAQALYDQILADNYRTTYAKAPGFEMRHPSNTAHSDFSQIFINPVVDDAIKAQMPLSEWPLDSLIIKDGTDQDGTVDLFAVMQKRADGWYWAEYLDPSAPDGGVKFSGKPDVCINCHQGAAANDFTQAITLPK